MDVVVGIALLVLFAGMGVCAISAVNDESGVSIVIVDGPSGTALHIEVTGA